MTQKLKALVQAHASLLREPTISRSAINIAESKRAIEQHMMRSSSENLFVFASEVDANIVIVVRFDHNSQNVFINFRSVVQ